MNTLYLLDKARYDNGEAYILRFLWVLRLLAQVKNPFLKAILKLIHRRYRLKYGLEISPLTKIGKGLYLGHAFNITINQNSIIGDNCNIHRGVLIGQENRGDRKGTPQIGSQVWIGINASIVGKVVIGDDVLIAPNTFVNCDVPSHSVVFGNPCTIKHKENATKGYINRIV